MNKNTMKFLTNGKHAKIGERKWIKEVVINENQV